MFSALRSEHSLPQKEVIWLFPLMNSRVPTNLHPEMNFTCDNKPKAWNAKYLCSLQFMWFGVFLNKMVTGTDRHCRVSWFWKTQSVGPKGKQPNILNVREFLAHTAATDDSWSTALFSGIFISGFVVMYMTFQYSSEVCHWRSINIFHSEATPMRRMS